MTSFMLVIVSLSSPPDVLSIQWYKIASIHLKLNHLCDIQAHLQDKHNASLTDDPGLLGLCKWLLGGLVSRFGQMKIGITGCC